MSMSNDNNFINTYGNTNPPAETPAPAASATPATPASANPAPVEFKTAGQAMQPPILSPSTIARQTAPSAAAAPVSATAAAPVSATAAAPATQAVPMSQPILTPQMMSPATPASPAPGLASAVSQNDKAVKKQEKAAKKQAKKEMKLAKKQGQASSAAGASVSSAAAGASISASAAGAPAAISPSAGKRRVAAAAVAFCLLGAGLGVCGTIAYGMRWAEEVKSDAVSEAKKASKSSSKSAISKNKSGSSSTVLQGDRDYTVLNTGVVDTSEEHTAAEIYAANVNSTVGISTSIDYNYYGSKTTAAVSGSGFILTDDGYIVTNYHVIQDAKEVKVTTFDNKSYPAEIIGYDEDNDIAVLKIDAQGLTPVILGDSDSMNVGDDVVAIGNPLGELSFSLTKGCISALNRTITIDNKPMTLIQTDCAINSGNSGGALFNMYGEVIGITNAKYSNNGGTDASIESIGFAIPINTVRGMIESIIEKGYVSKPYIGVYAETVTPNTDYKATSGIGIHDIIPGSPAERAKLKKGDVIIKIDGQYVTDIAELKSNIARAGIGGKLELTILRDGKEITVEVDVEENKTS